MLQEKEYEQTEQWHAILRKDGYVTWVMWTGDRNGALEQLDSLCAIRPNDAMYVAVDPVFVPLRSEPQPFVNTAAGHFVILLTA